MDKAELLIRLADIEREYYNVLIQRLRNYADNPFRMGDNGFAYEDDTQLAALREGLVNMLMHADYLE